jgi:membrane protein
MALGVGALFFASLAASALIQALGRIDIAIPGRSFLLGESGFWQPVLRIFPLLIAFGIFALIYRFIPNCKTYWRYVWPGALVAALMFELSKGLFLWYLENVATYDQVYGNLASVVVFLFWAYLTSLILILGAEISSEYERLYHPGLAKGKTSEALSQG